MLLTSGEWSVCVCACVRVCVCGVECKVICPEGSSTDPDIPHLFLSSPFSHEAYGNRAIAFLKTREFRSSLSDSYRCIVLNPDGWKVGGSMV